MAGSKKIVVLVSGRGSNLQALIDAHGAGKIRSRVIAVVSNKPGVFALERAGQAGIATLVVPSKGVAKAEYDRTLLQTVSDLDPDLVVLAGYMKILDAGFVRAFFGRLINIHPSLLPAFPGLDAQRQALEAGALLTGCTVHFVDEGCDTGPVILQNSIAIEPNDTVESLSARLLPVEHATLVEAVRLIEDDKVIAPGKQTLVLK